MADTVYVLDSKIYFFPDAGLLSKVDTNQAYFLSRNESGMLLALISGVIEKAFLIKQVWGARGVIVTESSYYKTLHTLRARLQVFGLTDGGIKTIPRVGAVLRCTVSTASTEDVNLAEIVAAHVWEDIESNTANDGRYDVLKKPEGGVELEVNKAAEHCMVKDRFCTKKSKFQVLGWTLLSIMIFSTIIFFYYV